MERSFKMTITLEKGLIRDWKKTREAMCDPETQRMELAELRRRGEPFEGNKSVFYVKIIFQIQQGFRASDTYQTGTWMNRSVLRKQAVLIRRKLCREPLQTKPSGKREDNSSIVVPYPHVLPIDSIGSASKSTSVNYSSFDLFIFTLSKTFG
ncbi:unnamed protein product [Caenorhabditis brenneri]